MKNWHNGIHTNWPCLKSSHRIFFNFHRLGGGEKMYECWEKQLVPCKCEIPILEKYMVILSILTNTAWRPQFQCGFYGWLLPQIHNKQSAVCTVYTYHSPVLASMYMVLISPMAIYLSYFPQESLDSCAFPHLGRGPATFLFLSCNGMCVLSPK